MRKLFLIIFISILIIGSNPKIYNAQNDKDDLTFEELAKKDYFTKSDFRYEEIFQKIDENDKKFGLAKNENLILIKIGGLKSDFLRDEKLMPNLSKLKSQRGAYTFINYIPLIGADFENDAEFSMLHSLYPHGEKVSVNNYEIERLFGLPKIAKKNGYNANAYFYSQTKNKQNKDFLKKLDFDSYFYHINEDKNIMTDDFFNQILNDMKKEDNVFNYISVELFGKNLDKSYDNIDLQFRKDKLNKQLKRFDESFYEFITKIKNQKRDAIIVICGDYGPIDDEKYLEIIEDYIDVNKKSKVDRLASPLIILTNDKNDDEIFYDTCSNLDILPTILNLKAWNENIPIFGKNLFKDSELKNYVYPQKPFPKGSYIYNENRELKLGNKENMDMHHKANIEIDLCEGILRKDRIIEIMKKRETNFELNLDGKYTIAHAGGELDGMSYTNMKEALDKNYKRGKRIFEIDIEMTSDNLPVCIHSWDGFSYKFLNKDKHKKLSYEEFMSAKSPHGYTQMDLKILVSWFKEHSDAYLVTDIKNKNYEVLEMISKDSPEIIDRIWPQIYNRNQYEKIKNLGYKNIIYTLYMSPDTDEEILDFALNNDIKAITISHEKYESGLGKKLIEQGITTFVHTINHAQDAAKLIDEGVKGIYTDNL
ncbi:MAG: hypothetical protein Q4P29_01365 [Tissierellia bacterium]|nr:hypothetical protein [Tissierellia bacterium]